MPAAAEKHVAGVDGARRRRARSTPSARDLMLEVRVRDTLALPDSAIVRFSDPKGDEHRHAITLRIGKDLEIKAGRDRRSNATVRSSRAQIVALEPEFGARGAEIVVRALDKGHKLQRERKVRTFQQVSAADIVKQDRRRGGPAGDATSPRAWSYEFFQQSAETDWELHRPARARPRLPLLRRGQRSSIPPRRQPRRERRSTLTWQDNLISFRPRVSGVQQVADGQRAQLGPQEQAGGHRQRRRAAHDREPARASSAARSSSDLGGGTTLVADRVAVNTGEANAIAKSALDGRADAFVEAEGAAFGNPEDQGRLQGQDQGRRHEARRDLPRLRPRPTSTGARRATQTSFQISGRSERGLLDLMHPPEQARLEPRPRGRRRDQQQRPRRRWGACGSSTPRSATREEGAWARVASVSAGNERGADDAPAGRTRR